MTFYNVKITKL